MYFADIACASAGRALPTVPGVVEKVWTPGKPWQIPGQLL